MTVLHLGFLSFLLGVGLLPDASKIGFSRGDLKLRAVMKNVGDPFLVLAGFLGRFAYLSTPKISIQEKDGRILKIEEGPPPVRAGARQSPDNAGGGEGDRELGLQ